MTRDVIIVGAGPTGLWLAFELRSAGLDVTVIERNVQRDIRSRAAAMAAGSVETFATRGIAQLFIDAGKPIHSVHYGSSATRLQFSKDVLGTKYPHSLMIPQKKTEELLIEACKEKGVHFLLGYNVVDLTQDQSGVTVTCQSEGLAPVIYAASWLLGCDGTKSIVREKAGFDFPGSDRDLSGWLGDVLATDPPEEPLSVNNESGCFLMQPLGYENYYRVTGVRLDRMKSAHESAPTLDEVKAHAVSATGKDFGMHSPLWFSRYGNATRLVSNYRIGRVFVAGDAAHQFFPAGGQGITTGLADAANLAWKLAAVINGRVKPEKADSLLDSYNTERSLALRAIINGTLAQTGLYAPENVRQRALADVVYEIIAFPNVNRLLAQRLTGFGDPFPGREETGEPLLGRRVTHLEIGGGFDKLLGAMDVSSFILINRSAAIEERLEKATSPWSHWIKRFGVADGIATFDEQWNGVDAVLLRPDGRIIWASMRVVEEYIAGVICWSYGWIRHLIYALSDWLQVSKKWL
ncbi:unnamed protein product [Clonostachys byssicola]|uniref:FAD-binding domain-containing protein n=1 Tax=Clonostachys byssicola TaxID=160290 RepID=A0A9N9YA77_9HYPO|nr:unnamed protein product [Clonostachys byssicola]